MLLSFLKGTDSQWSHGSHRGEAGEWVMPPLRSLFLPLGLDTLRRRHISRASSESTFYKRVFRPPCASLPRSSSCFGVSVRGRSCLQIQFTCKGGGSRPSGAYGQTSVVCSVAHMVGNNELNSGCLNLLHERISKEALCLQGKETQQQR